METRRCQKRTTSQTGHLLAQPTETYRFDFPRKLIYFPKKKRTARINEPVRLNTQQRKGFRAKKTGQPFKNLMLPGEKWSLIDKSRKT
jgi:hypothetical protein